MFSGKRDKQRADEMTNMIRAILPAEATLISFDYDAKCFGNIVVEIEAMATRHIFITDRGEISHNGKLLCDSSYHHAGEDDTFPRLLQMIGKELS